MSDNWFKSYRFFKNGKKSQVLYQYLVNAFCEFKNLKLYTFLIHGKEIKMHFPREFQPEELSLHSDALFHCVFVCFLPVVICFTNSMCMKGFFRHIITRKLITFIAIKVIFQAQIQYEFVSLFSM